MIATEELARSFCADRCDRAAMERLDAFCNDLLNENTRQNLIAKSSLDEVWVRHIADSAQLLDHVSHETPIWLDLGTGAGFPGLVVAIMRPEWEVILVESRRKRIDWLSDMAIKFGLSNCRVEGVQLAAVNPFPATVISARAFAPLPKLLNLAKRFSTEQTTFILPKGRSAEQELMTMPQNQRKLFHVEQSITSSEAGIIVGKLADI